MDDTEETPTPATTPVTSSAPVKTPQELAAEAEAERKQRQTIIIASICVVLGLIALIAIGIWLIQPGTPTDKIRDVFIIFLALESLIIGAALVVLIVQIATLMNLLNNEIKPMLEATNETISTLRGTTQF